MFFRRVFGTVFLFLLLGGVFGLFNGRSQDAYTQGYIAGQQSVTTTGEGNNTAVPPAPQPYQNSGFGFLGGIVKFFAFFFGFIFLMGFMGMLFGCKRRNHKRGWHHAQHWGNWQEGKEKPPWYDPNDNDEPVMKA